MLKGVLFDMDGVLFDSERPCVLQEREVARQLGFEMPDALFSSLPGLSTDETGAALRAAFGPGFDYPAFRARVAAELKRYDAEHGTVLMPQVRETLHTLAGQGWAMAVASAASTHSVQRRLAETGLAHFFTAALGVEATGGVGKPAPDLFLAGAAALGLAPAQCAAVEDSYNGVRSAAAAGCVTVMIPDLLPPTDEMRALCAAILPDMGRLPGFLARYNSDEAQP